MRSRSRRVLLVQVRDGHFQRGRDQWNPTGHRRGPTGFPVHDSSSVNSSRAAEIIVRESALLANAFDVPVDRKKAGFVNAVPGAFLGTRSFTFPFQLSLHSPIVDISSSASQRLMTKSQRRKMASSRVTMGDARHPKPYPRGPKHPKLGLTEAWKRRVDHALEANKKANRAPRGRTELARMIKADPGGLGRMLDSNQETYKYAKQISELLGIPYAKVDNPELTDGAAEDDDWSIYVARVKALPEARQRRLLRMFQVALEDDE